jgi:hypothetical protein
MVFRCESLCDVRFEFISKLKKLVSLLSVCESHCDTQAKRDFFRAGSSDHGTGCMFFLIGSYRRPGPFFRLEMGILIHSVESTGHHHLCTVLSFIDLILNVKVYLTLSVTFSQNIVKGEDGFLPDY